MNQTDVKGDGQDATKGRLNSLLHKAGGSDLSHLQCCQIEPRLLSMTKDGQ